MPFIMGTPDEPFLIIYCLALTKHIYKKIKSKYLNTTHINTPIKKYLNKSNLWAHINTHINTPIIIHINTHKENTHNNI